MQTVTEGLGKNESSGVWRTLGPTDMYVQVDGTFDGETYTLQWYSTAGAAWETFTYDATRSSTTFDGSTTGDARKYEVGGGLRFRVTGDDGGTSPDVDVKVDGLVRIE